MTAILRGQQFSFRYAEGIGTASKFATITSMLFVSDNQLIIADRDNHCLRQVTISNLNSSTFAGSCENEGDVEGHRLTAALLSQPSHLVHDAKNNILYAGCMYMKQIMQIDLNTDYLSLFHKFANNDLTNIRSMNMLSETTMIISSATKMFALVKDEPDSDVVKVKIAHLENIAGRVSETQLSSVYGAAILDGLDIIIMTSVTNG